MAFDGPYAPSVSSNPPSDVRYSTAVAGGNVTNDNGAEVTARGIVLGTEPDPNQTPYPPYFQNQIPATAPTGTGAFTVNLTGLIPGVKYYYRAYAINSVYISYGVEYSFRTLSGNFTTSF